MHSLWLLMERARGSSAILVRKTRYRYRPTASLIRRILLNEGPAGKRPRESSSQETDEATFAKQLANELYRRVHSGNFAALVLIADPQTLGQIRPSLHKEVQDRLVTEIGKTLTHASIADIQKALK